MQSIRFGRVGAAALVLAVTIGPIRAGANPEISTRPEPIPPSIMPADAIGLTTVLPGSILRYLPGEGEEVLDALDTHVRWRPGVTWDGTQDELPGTRREELGSSGAAPGPGWIALSPGAAPLDAALRGLTREATDQGGSRNRLGANVGATVGSYGASDLEGELHLRSLPWSALPLRGGAWLRASDADDAAPRATTIGPLPHNDARRLEIASRLDAGRVGRDAPWGLALTFAARGWARNHFVELYRHDLEHAPREEGARLEFGADAMLRLARLANAHLRFDYGSFQHSLADGSFRKDVQRYDRPGGNTTADETGLYWPGATSAVLSGAHVFDYYRWLQTREWRTSLSVARTSDSGSRLEARARIAGSTYRRFEHFAPTLLGSEGEPTGRALLIGYDAAAGVPADTPFAPGRALSARGEIVARVRRGERFGLDLRAGGLAFSSRDSVLADPHRPYGANGRLGSGDLAAPVWHTAPEASIGLRWNRSPRVSGWVLGYRRAHLPPLEALYSARPYLVMVRPEGVMPNPALSPELESGGEVGLALPFPMLPRTWSLAIAGYAGRIDDAIAMTAAWLGKDGGLVNGWVPLYENRGTLRRRGIHLEATTGSGDSPTWARVSYDYGRIETDSVEPMLLDEAWLYPDQAQGEYETEGYPGPLGGILDGIAAARPGGYRASYLDRAHSLSVALVHHLAPPPAGASGIGRLTGGWTIGAIARFESGRPYTQTYAHPAVLPPGTVVENRGVADPAWEQPIKDGAWNAYRMAARWTLDLALQRRVAFGPLGLRFTIEALNLLDIANVSSVYRATGEPERDGCDGSPDCLGPEILSHIDEAGYAERLRDPLHYDRPLVLRGAVRLELF